MMGSYFLCTFALVALPLSVMAIHCYYCTPGPSGDLCKYTTNIIDCDTSPDAPPGIKFDTCGKASYQFSVEGNELTMNTLTCAVQSMCGIMNKTACDAEMWNQVGLNLTKCNVRCCSEDLCNCPEPPCQALPPFSGSGETE